LGQPLACADQPVELAEDFAPVALDAGDGLSEETPVDGPTFIHQKNLADLRSFAVFGAIYTGNHL
jgi:hypothetical protein